MSERRRNETVLSLAWSMTPSNISIGSRMSVCMDMSAGARSVGRGVID